MSMRIDVLTILNIVALTFAGSMLLDHADAPTRTAASAEAEIAALRDLIDVVDSDIENMQRSMPVESLEHVRNRIAVMLGRIELKQPVTSSKVSGFASAAVIEPHDPILAQESDR